MNSPLTTPQTTNPVSEIQDKIRNLLENTSDMIYFKDLNSVFTLCSDSLTRRLTGGTEESVIGKSDFDFSAPESALKFFEDEQEIIRTGNPIIGQVEKEIRDGEMTWVSSSKLPLRDTEGNIIGTFGISRDVTDQKLTEAKLRKTNDDLVAASRRAGKAEIATNVIHNVGNVLNSVKVAVSQSEEICNGLQTERFEKVADLIEQHGREADFFEEGNRGSHVPEYLRRLAAAYQAERAKLRKELGDARKHLEHISNIVAQQQCHATSSQVIDQVDLSELISDAVQLSSSSLEKHNIEVVFDFEEGLIAETDKHQVLQIIVNLIRNAKHACLDSDNHPMRITISATNNREANNYSISVADNGIGIRKENFAKLFTFGFTTRERGKGFGLHGSANTARELGGSLNVESDGPNKGATFVLTLPGKLN